MSNIKRRARRYTIGLLSFRFLSIREQVDRGPRTNSAVSQVDRLHQQLVLVAWRRACQPCSSPATAARSNATFITSTSTESFLFVIIASRPLISPLIVVENTSHISGYLINGIHPLVPRAFRGNKQPALGLFNGGSRMVTCARCERVCVLSNYYRQLCTWRAPRMLVPYLAAPPDITGYCKNEFHLGVAAAPRTPLS